MRNVDITPVCKFTMSSGVGSLGNNTACVMAQAAILDALDKGKPIVDLTDKLDCACPVLRKLAITLNDGRWWADDLQRTRILRPLLTLILDSKSSLTVTAKRAELAAKFAEYVIDIINANSCHSWFLSIDPESFLSDVRSNAREAAHHADAFALYQLPYDSHVAITSAEDAAWSAGVLAEEAVIAIGDKSPEDLLKLRTELLSVWMQCEAIR